jgi:hypothetical protein
MNRQNSRLSDRSGQNEFFLPLLWRAARTIGIASQNYRSVVIVRQRQSLHPPIPSASTPFRKVLTPRCWPPRPISTSERSILARFAGLGHVWPMKHRLRQLLIWLDDHVPISVVRCDSLTVGLSCMWRDYVSIWGISPSIEDFWMKSIISQTISPSIFDPVDRRAESFLLQKATRKRYQSSFPMQRENSADMRAIEIRLASNLRPATDLILLRALIHISLVVQWHECDTEHAHRYRLVVISNLKSIGSGQTVEWNCPETAKIRSEI